jgi:hypothetical protein
LDDLPRLIFTLSPGRCGTKYLAALLNAIPGVCGIHEPEPDFVDWARAARRDPAEARAFWQDKKLPHIRSLDCETYAETSHLFGKGFVRPLLDLGVVPDVVVLKRNDRDVALSIWRRGGSPAKTLKGERYWLHPEQAEFCPLPRWWAFTDYQLCYWYTLEMANRMRSRVSWIEEAGGQVARLDFDTLTGGKLGWIDGCHAPDNITSWLKIELGLPSPDQVRFDLIQSDFHNATPAERRDLMPPGDLDEQEKQVRDAIASADKATVDIRKKIDVVVLSMDTMHRELVMALLGLSQDRRYNITIGTATARPRANNRCQICREFVDNERRPDWLLMIDEDTVPHGDFLSWVESDYDVISIATPCWKPVSHPESPIAWNVQLDPALEKLAPAVSVGPDALSYVLPSDKPVIDVASAGTGVVFIRRAVLEHPAMRAPFKNVYNEFGIRLVGADLNFCARAREAGFRVVSVLQNPASHYRTVDLLAVAKFMGGLR